VPAIRPRYGAALAAVLLIPAGCGDRDSSPYEPPTTTRDPRVERTVASFEKALNRKDPVAVCALYNFPSRNCTDVWRARLARLAIPIDLPIAEIVYGCAGEARATIATPAGNAAINTVTVSPQVPGVVDDVGFGHRRSSLVIPRYGDCAAAGGSAGDGVCDEANRWGAEDSLDECRRRK
jgi:hypothetical protein